MKLLTNKKIDALKVEQKKSAFKIFQNITRNTPKKANALDKVIAEQLDRTIRRIDEWRIHVDAAEDIDNPDRQGLMEYYKDFIDDYQLHATRQSRTLKATIGNFHIYDEKGDIDEEEEIKFLNPKGRPHKWFRDFMKYIMDSKFYGWEAIQLGDVVDNKFSWIEKIPEENQIPYYDAMVKDANISFIASNDNSNIFFEKEPWNTWVIRVGSTTDLGLINKCAPYIIYKSVFGNWSQHASVFGMPLRHAKTDLADNERRQNLINALEEMTGSSFMITDLMDELEVIEQKGGGDPHQIYGEFINKCDSAISKIVLSQTGTTDEKSFAGAAAQHGKTEDEIIYSDKQDIEAIVNDELIPRMKKIGMIDSNKKIYGAWDFSEKVTIKEWSEIILSLSQSGFIVLPEEVENLTGVKVDSAIIPVPENKNISVMNKVEKLYYGKRNK